MKLYTIDESDVTVTISHAIQNETAEAGKKVAINKDLTAKYGYPLKVVYMRDGGKIVVVSAYPLRKERSK